MASCVQRDSITPTARWQGHACNANARANMIDYVFYSGVFRARPVAVPVIDAQTPLPSYDQPSDHLALMAYFDWH